jgi:hypothetical protein
VKRLRSTTHPLQTITPPNDSNIKADFPQLLGVQKHPPVEHESRLVHTIVNRLPVDITELLPLRRDHDSLGTCASREGTVMDGHTLLD